MTQETKFSCCCCSSTVLTTPRPQMPVCDVILPSSLLCPFLPPIRGHHTLHCLLVSVPIRIHMCNLPFCERNERVNLQPINRKGGRHLDWVGLWRWECRRGSRLNGVSLTQTINAALKRMEFPIISDLALDSDYFRMGTIIPKISVCTHNRIQNLRRNPEPRELNGKESEKWTVMNRTGDVRC